MKVTERIARGVTAIFGLIFILFAVLAVSYMDRSNIALLIQMLMFGLLGTALVWRASMGLYPKEKHIIPTEHSPSGAQHRVDNSRPRHWN